MSKNLKKMVSNPFVGDQFFETEVLAKDSSIKHTNQNTLINSKRKFLNQNSIFMSIKEKYLNFVNLITKNAIVATLVMLLALTTVGASAAELLAPEEYKPSTQIQNLFTANKQIEKNPYTALKPDGENDVAISDKCDLAIKYPKQIGNKEINIYNNNSTESETNDLRKGVLAINGGLKDMENNSTANQRLNDFVIACFDKNQNREDIVSKEVYQASQGLSYAEISKEELRERYGWFITEANMERIALYKAQSPSGEIQENILFNYQDKLYWMYIIPETNNIFKEDLNPNGIFGNQVQLQFNSLVKSEPNAEIVEKKTETQKDTTKTQPLVADSEHDVVVIEECDLAVRFKKGIGISYSNIELSMSINSKSQDLFSFQCEPQGTDIMAPYLQLDIKDRVAINGNSTGSINKNDIKILTEKTKEVISGEIYSADIFTEPTIIDNKPNFKTIGFRYNDANFIITKEGSDDFIARNDLIQLQFNSLAPSTPSVSLKQLEEENKATIKASQETYTNSRYPNITFTYNSDWTVTEDFSSNLPGADYIKIIKDNSKIELFFPRGIGSQAFYQCFNSSDIQILGKFIYFINSNGDRAVAPAEKFVLQKDSNFNSVKEKVKNWTIEQNQSMIPAGDMPLPSSNDNICQNGWDYFFSTKSTLDSNYLAPFEINVTNTNHTEAKEILKSLKY